MTIMTMAAAVVVVVLVAAGGSDEAAVANSSCPRLRCLPLPHLTSFAVSDGSTSATFMQVPCIDAKTERQMRQHGRGLLLMKNGASAQALPDVFRCVAPHSFSFALKRTQFHSVGVVNLFFENMWRLLTSGGCGGGGVRVCARDSFACRIARGGSGKRTKG